MILIERQLRDSAFSEYAIYVKGLILRQRGQISEALQLFQTATALNPQNPSNLKQVANTLILLGKQRQAIEVFEEARLTGAALARKRGLAPPEDREVLHQTGLCHMQLGQLGLAVGCFERANMVEPADGTFLMLAKAHEEAKDPSKALAALEGGCAHSPNNPEMRTSLGLLKVFLSPTTMIFPRERGRGGG